MEQPESVQESSPRRRATQKRQREILDAALACFLKEGFESATIEQIREASGASFGSIYHHFGSKQAIAAALYIEGLTEIDEVLHLARIPHRNVQDGIRTQIAAYFAWVESHREFALYLFRVSTADQADRVAMQIDEVAKSSLQRLADWLQPFITRGDVVQMPDELYGTVVFGPCSHFARHWLTGRVQLEPAVVAGQLADCAIRALCPRAGEAVPDADRFSESDQLVSGGPGRH